LPIISNDISFFNQIREDLKNNPFAISIQGQLRSHHQIQDFSSDYAKFELLYCDGLLYVPDGPSQLQVL
jgi:hypothetical protein